MTSMAECCSAQSDPVARTQATCSQCGSAGVRVEMLTVKSLLTQMALRRLVPAPFYLCLEPVCPVVYFTNSGQEYPTTDVRVVPWQKQPAGRRTICYCFDENEPSMLHEMAHTGRCAAIQRIRDHIAAARCACEVRNPRGTCCLGDLVKAVVRIEAGAVPEL